MMPAANQGVGMNMGMPDVCTTPAAPSPIPIPYPNMGMNAMAMPFIPNVLVSMAPAQNMGAKPLLTNGDNAGVAHPLFMQPGGTLVGNPLILMGGMPAAHLGVPTYGNNFNNPVGAKTVPSVTNVLLGSTALLDPHVKSSLANQLRREAGIARVLAHAIALVQLPILSLRTDRWLTLRLQWLSRQGTAGLVLDLRGNPGGSIRVAQRVADSLAKTNLPIAVAVDNRTASAAELLTARLHDRHDARVFGERTYGKGHAMAYWCGNGWLCPTGSTAAILRPDGGAIHRVGIMPDESHSSRDALRAAAHFLRNRRSNRS